MTRAKEKILAAVMVLVFRLNGRLLAQGDRLVADRGLTSARWQVLGAIALAERPLTAPQIAEAMGLTRQGVQKQLNLLLAEGLLARRSNPAHERSPLYELTPSGAAAFAAADQLCDLWTQDLGATLAAEDVRTTERVLSALLARLDRSLPIDANPA